MNDYIIATASTADLTPEYLQQHHIPFISYPYVLDGKEYRDDCRPETRVKMYEAMRNGAEVSTSAISIYDYHKFFVKLMQEKKDILYLDMTSAISSSLKNAQMAANMIREEYPEQRFVYLETYAVTDILGLLVKKAVSMKEAGASLDEVISWLESHKLEYIGRFMVDDLKWLRKGGRLSNASAWIGTLLSIKPLIIVDDDGKLVAYKKAHGKRKAWSELIADMKDTMNEQTPEEEVAVIHSGTPEDAEQFRIKILETYPQLKKVTVNLLGPVITAHVGPGFMAVVYHGTNRK